MKRVAPQKLCRLLAPRHVAVVGGRDAEIVIGECRRIGFSGPIWPVNPKRREIAGLTCFAQVEDLPEAPDATFVAVPREAALDVTARLRAMDAGGVVMYTAGFGELGKEGQVFEEQLSLVLADMPLIGPNCYGFINYLDRVALWPFAHGGGHPGYGAAIITQSGMLGSDITMSQRSVPLAFMISAGNQTQLASEDFIHVLLERDEVRAIGLHIEGIRDLSAFATAARTALQAGVPIVALKTGSSKIAAELAVTHTGSLSGTDELYDALFDKLGIVRVQTPSQLLETLKFMCVAGLPKGRRLGGFTCSGGGAAMLADAAERAGLELPPPTESVSKKLRERLPPIATVSNPLDYTTPIWGDREKVPPVFSALLEDSLDVAVLVQDYPAPDLDESKVFYRNDATSFVEATRKAGLPAAICSTLPENFDRETRDYLVSHGVAPMQGIAEAAEAIALCARAAERRAELDGAPLWQPLPVDEFANSGFVLDESSAKDQLRAAGIEVPEGVATDADKVVEVAGTLGYPVVLKWVNRNLAHKTEIGAVVAGLNNETDLSAALPEMAKRVAVREDAGTGWFLVERMLPAPVAELLVSVRRDAQFGAAMTIASGGVLTELVADAATLVLPAHDDEIHRVLARLRVSRLLRGFRGAAPIDESALVTSLQAIAKFVVSQLHEIIELEINPLFVYRERAPVAIDAVLRVQS